MIPGNSLNVGLLSEDVTSQTLVAPYVILLTTVICSCTGMIVLKYAEQTDNAWLLCSGYVLEGVSFCLYPVCMRYFSLRIIIVLWSSGSNITAFLSGALLFSEGGGFVGLCGMILNIVGVIVVSFSTTLDAQ